MRTLTTGANALLYGVTAGFLCLHVPSRLGLQEWCPLPNLLRSIVWHKMSRRWAGLLPKHKLTVIIPYMSVHDSWPIIVLITKERRKEGKLLLLNLYWLKLSMLKCYINYYVHWIWVLYYIAIIYYCYIWYITQIRYNIIIFDGTTKTDRMSWIWVIDCIICNSNNACNEPVQILSFCCPCFRH